MQLACELQQFPQPEPSGHQGMAIQALHSRCRGTPASELMWGYPGGYHCCLCPNKDTHDSCCSSKGQTVFWSPDQQKPLEKVAEVLGKMCLPRSHDSSSLETLKHTFPPSLVSRWVQIHLGALEPYLMPSALAEGNWLRAGSLLFLTLLFEDEACLCNNLLQVST